MTAGPTDSIDGGALVVGGPDITAGALSLIADTDSDGVLDIFDNCTTVPNAGAQSCDTDMDGYGNACDADFNNDWVSNGLDFVPPHFLADFSSGSESANTAGNGQGTDMDCDGTVSGADFIPPYFLAGFSKGAPGPSGLFCAGTEPCVPEEASKAAFESPPALYTGQYAYVPFHVNPGWSVDFDDIVFEVLEGDGAGKISYSKDATFDPDHPTVMLLAGTVPGVGYTLRALYGGVEVASTKFSVTTEWANPRQGPPRWIEGPVGDPSPEGSTFGGGPVGLQNLDTKPIPPDKNPWEIAVVFLEFADRSFTNEAVTVADWMDAFLAETDSLKTYYEEVTDGQFSVNAKNVGTVQIAGNWEAAHTQQSNGVWKPKDIFYENCATAADADSVAFDPSDFDTLVCISATDTTSTKFTWPYGSSGRNIKTTDGDFTIGTVSMPDDWEIVDGRDPWATLAHELGHNLGLGDQYTPDVPDSDMPLGVRNLGSWEIMHDETEIPHVSLPFRMMWGLVDDTEVTSYDPLQETDGQISEKIRLTAVEKMAIKAGDDALGVEFRINDGRNYTFEYRHGLTDHMGDQGPTVPSPLKAVGAVLGIDVMEKVADSPLERPNLLHLAGGTALSAVGDIWYEDEPGTDNRLEVEVTAIDSDSVELWFRYGSFEAGIWDGASPAPDLVIQPWPSATHNWQSPDISVSNAQSAADPVFENVAVAGIKNTITATVKNDGNLDATNVTVSFWVKDQNVGASVPKDFIGSRVKNVAAGASVPFVFDSWVPDEGGHYCVVAEIEPVEGEKSVDNNNAQSNYDVVESGSASPAERIIRDVAVSNPYELPTWFQLEVDQDGEAFRTYLEATEVLLRAGETRKMRVMFEYTESAPNLARRATNAVSLTGWIYDPRPTGEGLLADAPEKAGGVDFQVLNGWRTRIGGLVTEVSRLGYTVRGNIGQIGTGTSVDAGQVFFTSVLRGGRVEHPPVPVGSDGSFEATFPTGTTTVKARFVPMLGRGQVQRSESGWISLR